MAQTAVKDKLNSKFTLPPVSPVTPIESDEDAATKIHWPEGSELRLKASNDIATYIDALMRNRAVNKTDEQRVNQPLCIGCVSLAALNAAMILAQREGTSKRAFANMLRSYADELDSSDILAMLRQMVQSDGD